MKSLVLPILLLLTYSSLVEAQSQSSFESANAAYEKSDYAVAAKQYEKILEDGSHGEAVYYNLANSYYKEKHLGKAILNYERALLLDPRNENVLFNLAVAKEKVAGEIDPVPPFFLLSWWYSLRNVFSSTIWGGLALLFFWAGVGGLSLWQLGKNRTLKKKGFLGGVALIILSLLPLCLAWSAYQHQKDSNEGVLIATSTSLKSGADKGSEEVRSVYEGTKLELLDQINVWHKVRLENGETGWLEEGTFEEI